MKFAFFYHSLLSDWNHGNAHFLRGVLSELIARGHEAIVYEPQDGWSRRNLVEEHGENPVEEFRARYPQLTSKFYNLGALDLDSILTDTEVVIVHEWNAPELILKLGEHRRKHRGYRLLFHDTHHRSVSDTGFLGTEGLKDFDGALVFGESLRELYLHKQWSPEVWVWHEAADTRVFKPLTCPHKAGDLVWIGNWGDDERTREITDFLLTPVGRAGLRCEVHGVRYPAHALQMLSGARISYRGWLPNFRVPEVFSRFLMTVHIPREPYRKKLPGVPTIRVFEALACGIPLICAPWDDCENLFSPGKDYLIAKNGAEMTEKARELMTRPELRRELSEHGLETIAARHTCRHRVDQLLEIVTQ